MKIFLGAFFWLVAWLLFSQDQSVDHSFHGYSIYGAIALALLPLLFGVRLIYQSVIALIAIGFGVFCVYLGASSASFIDACYALLGCAIVAAVDLAPDRVWAKVNTALLRIILVFVVTIGCSLIGATSAGYILFGLWLCLGGLVALWFGVTGKPVPSFLHILGIADANKL